MDDNKEVKDENTEEETIENDENNEEKDDLQQDIDHLRDRLIRLQADYENYRKRTEEEKKYSWRLGVEDLACEILPVIDNIERAVESFKEDGMEESQLEGLALIEQGILEVLSKNDIEQIDALGEPFDPNFHNAIQTMESEDMEPDTVMIEVNKGYKSKDKVIRPTTVIVSK